MKAFYNTGSNKPRDPPRPEAALIIGDSLLRDFDPEQVSKMMMIVFLTY